MKGKLRKVVTQKNVYEGDKVIVAAGYASRKLLGTVGIDVPMSNDLIEALVTEAEPKMFGQMLGTADADFYLTPDRPWLFCIRRSFPDLKQ